MISLKQWRSAISVVGCELNSRTCKLDATRFISFVPVIQFGCFILSVEALKSAVHSESMYSGPTLCESHEMSFVHPKHAFMPCWIAVQYCIVVDCE